MQSTCNFKKQNKKPTLALKKIITEDSVPTYNQSAFPLSWLAWRLIKGISLTQLGSSF